jgi:hypothetical protein
MPMEKMSDVIGSMRSVSCVFLSLSFFLSFVSHSPVVVVLEAFSFCMFLLLTREAKKGLTSYLLVYPIG